MDINLYWKLLTCQSAVSKFQCAERHLRGAAGANVEDAFFAVALAELLPSMEGQQLKTEESMSQSGLALLETSRCQE